MQFMGSGRGGTLAWLFQRVSGVALVVILFLHFILIHFMTDGAITYEKVAWRLSSPYYKAWELMFLCLGLIHAMNGLKLIIDDYVHNEGWRTLLTSLNWVVTLLFFFFGAITVITFTYQPS